MKTTCYCILCPKHPLYAKRKDLKVLTGFDVGDPIHKPEHVETGKEVDCLDPESDAFGDLDIDPQDHEFPVTAYGDGNAVTGFEGAGYVISAWCSNETYIGEDNK